MFNSVIQVIIAITLVGILPVAVVLMVHRLTKFGRPLAVIIALGTISVQKSIFKWLGYNESIKTVSASLTLLIWFLAIVLFGDQILGKKDESHEDVEEN
jgi:ABC-type Fe3+ transport system permease subunit